MRGFESMKDSLSTAKDDFLCFVGLALIKRGSMINYASLILNSELLHFVFS